MNANIFRFRHIPRTMLLIAAARLVSIGRHDCDICILQLATVITVDKFSLECCICSVLLVWLSW